MVSEEKKHVEGRIRPILRRARARKRSLSRRKQKAAGVAVARSRNTDNGKNDSNVQQNSDQFFGHRAKKKKRMENVNDVGIGIDGIGNISSKPEEGKNRMPNRQSADAYNDDTDTDEFLRQAMLNSLAYQNKTSIDEVPFAPSVCPTAAEFKDPMGYISELHKIGVKYGAVQIVPPRDWKPEFAIHESTYRVPTRRQRVDQLCSGKGFPGGHTYTLDSYREMAGKFEQEHGAVNASVCEIERKYWDLVNGKAGELTVEYGNDISSAGNILFRSPLNQRID